MDEVEKYIRQFEPEVQERLHVLRRLFFDLLPNTEESIRYKMPAYKAGKHHLYFAAYKKHIGFYPVYGLEDLALQLSPYRAKGTKDSLHFLHSEPLATELIKEIIRRKSELK